MAASDLVPALQTAVKGFNTVVDGKLLTIDAKLPTAQTALDGARVSRDSALGACDTTILSRDAAYRDLRSAQANLDHQNLSALAISKAITAVDVFIYDTSKDSDGGAWRKRCTKTSWFNEPLNTEFRGARREFPAVVVIVATTTTVTIYDGDDPALPMWMVFRYGQIGTNGYFLGPGSGIFKVAMLNGVLSVGKYMFGDLAFYGHFRTANFISERIDLWLGYYNKHVVVPSVIAKRNSADFGIGDTSSSFPSIGPGIVDGRVLDVAMTIMPDAPADPLSGLPMPTIAVGTANGLSVINPDGTVYDATATEYGANARSPIFTGKGKLVWLSGGSSSQHYIQSHNFPFTGDFNAYGNDIAVKRQGLFLRDMVFDGELLHLPRVYGTTDNAMYSALVDFGSNTLLAQVNRTAAYVTGWMPGDIRGAILADTDATALVESGELVTNGGFDADLTGWVDFSLAGGSISWNPSGALDISNVTGNGGAYQAVPVTIGHRYRLSFENVGTVNVHYYVGTSVGGTQLRSVTMVNAGSTGETEFVATTSTIFVTFDERTAGETSTIDNVSVRRIDNDRSIKRKGLIVNGTVTRSPVATGAELVAYSGFSESNYLEQPYNADLDFGTGDFCVMGWGRTNINGTFLSRGDGVSAGSWFWKHLGGSSSPFYIHDGAAWQLALNVALPQGDMVHFALLRRSGTIFLYGNGELMGSLSEAYPALSMTNLTAKLRIGEQQHTSYANASEKQALLRISATAPTTDQIRRIYEDEKVLFQENAACTLYGASDAVTALAHDPDTGLLHVGTSAGRSVFKGLRRVDNTTQPVTTAISAANGMVIEK